MGTRTVSVLSVLALSLNATVAFAAEPAAAARPYGNRDVEAPDLSETYEPEAVYVTGLAARVEDGSVTGSFKIQNTEETLVTGLQYRIELRGIGEEDGLPYSIDVVRTAIALSPNETKTLLLKGELPSVPAGRYGLRVQLLTAKGRSLGWADAPVVVTEDDGARDFATLFPGTIGIESHGDELLPPLSGPNVDPQGALTLRGTAINKGSAAIRVIPTVEVFDFNAARNRVATFEYAPLRIAAGESLPLDIPLSAEAVPGVYMAHVTLRDADTGEPTSTIAQYRFVVTGEDADIVAVRMENMGTKAGDWAYGQIDLSGSADALTTTTATLRVRLTDAAGELGSIEIPDVELTDAILTADIRIPLRRDLVGTPVVDASLLSDDAVTFDHVEYAGTLSAAQLETLTKDESLQRWVAWHGVARLSLFLFVMAAVGYGLFGLAMRMRNAHGTALTRTATAAFLLVAFALQTTSGFAAGSGGIEVLTPKRGSDVFAPLGNRPIVALFVNRPVHNEPNNFCDRQITLDYRLEYGVCENQISYVRVLGRVARNGGHYATYDPAGAQWETVHNREFTSGVCTQHFCFETETFTGTIDLTNVVDSNANETTLQLLAKYGKNIAMPTASFDRNDPFIMLGWAHALNIHLQCTPQPQFGCIEVLKEGFDANGNRIQTPLPNFTFQLDGNQTVQSDAQGRARFDGVSVGQHTVTENPLTGWTMFNVTPQNGQVQVSAGNNCAAVVFKNRQEPQDADLRIIKTALSQSVVRGQNAVFQIAVRNLGPAAAPNVVVGDPVPAGTTFVPSASDNRCQLQGNSVFCSLGTINPNQEVSFNIAFRANDSVGQCQPGTITNMAAVQSDRVDPNLQNNESEASVQVTCPQPQTGCIEILKEGFDAQGNRIQTPLPNFTFQLDGSQWQQSDAQGRARFENVSVGQHTVTEVPFTGWTMFNVTPQNGQVQVSAGNNCAAVVFKNRQEPQDADLRIIKTAATPTVVRGQTALFQIAVRNLGPAAATNVVIGDPVPAGATFLPGSSDSRCQLQGNSVFCSLGTMTANQEISVSLGFRVHDSAPQCQPGTLTNRAAVQSDRVDPNLQNNESEASVQVTCPQPQQADLRIVKTAQSQSVVRGQNAVFSIAVKNLGPATAPNVVVGDPVPAGTTFVTQGSDHRCQPQGNSVFCSLGTLTPNQEISFQIAFKTNESAGQCQPGTVTNRAAVQSDRVDPNLQNNESEATVQVTCPAPQFGCIEILKEGFDAGGSRLSTIPPFEFKLDNAMNVHSDNQGRARFSNVPVGQHVVTETPMPGWINFNVTPNDGIVHVTGGQNCVAVVFKNRQEPQHADLRIVKTGPATAVRGSNLTYQLAVRNLGPATATGVVVGDPVPAGTTFVPSVSDSRCQLQGNSVFCSLGSMTANQELTLQLTFATAVQQSCVPGTVTNRAAVQSDRQDPNLQNNESSVTTQLTCPSPQTADVSIQKTGPQTVQRGQNITYQLLVTNAGPLTASGVVVSDAIPAGLTLSGATLTQQPAGTTCAVTNNTINCQLGSLAPGATRTLSFVFATQAPTGQCETGTVTNTAVVTTTTQDGNSQNNQSSAVTQLTCATQTGCIDVIKETFDPFGNLLTPVTQFTFTLDGTRTAVNNSQGRARFENVSVGQHTVAETLPSGWSQQLVTPSGGTVNVTAGACATVTFKNKQNTLAVNEGFTISKTDGRSEAEPGDTLRYVITVRNVGATRQTNVTVTDELPDDVEFVDATPNESSENGRTIRWENQTFEAGETKTYEIEVEIDDDAEGETLLNTARVQDKTATDRTDVEDEDDEDEDLEIELRKTASTSEVFPGGIIDYTVTVENTGDETIEDITVVDQLPADVIIIDDGDADTRSGRRLEWEIDELEEGDSETFRYRVSVPTYMVAGQIIRNNVCVESDDLDDDVCESVTTTVLGIIPTTGTKATGSGESHLKPMVPAEPADGTLPFLAIIALAGVGTGVGAGFGRRLLIGV